MSPWSRRCRSAFVPQGCRWLLRNPEKKFGSFLPGPRSALSWPPRADEKQYPTPGRVPPGACGPLRATAASAGSARPRRRGREEPSVPPGWPTVRSPGGTPPECRGCAGDPPRTLSESRRCAASARSWSREAGRAVAGKTAGCELVEPHRKPPRPLTRQRRSGASDPSGAAATELCARPACSSALETRGSSPASSSVVDTSASACRSRFLKKTFGYSRWQKDF